VAATLVGPAPGRVVGIGVEDAFLAGILIHLVGLDRRVCLQRRRVGRPHRQILEPVPQSQQVGPVSFQLEGHPSRGDALGDTTEDQEDLRGRRWVLWNSVPVKALKTRPQASQR
jgi:hypothetical protein